MARKKKEPEPYRVAEDYSKDKCLSLVRSWGYDAHLDSGIIMLHLDNMNAMQRHDIRMAVWQKLRDMKYGCSVGVTGTSKEDEL